MSRLLVNAPSGKQEIVTVGDGGNYFDTSRVLWDERIDGLLPAVTLGGMTRQGNTLAFSQAMADTANGAVFATAKAAFIAQVDGDVDAIYAAVVGNRSDEYNAANDDAQAYKTAGYTGAVPATVQSWATAKGWTATQATDDILAAAVRLTTLRNTIRSARLLRKEQARAAADPAALATVSATWAATVAAIRTSAGL